MSDATDYFFFPKGIPGFEDLTDYRLSHSDTESGRVYWLEARDRPEIAFTLVDPKFYGLNYTLTLSDAEQDMLGIEQPEDVAVLLMLWKDENGDASPARGAGGVINANIAGPILINAARRLGMQKILNRPQMELNIVQ